MSFMTQPGNLINPTSHSLYRKNLFLVLNNQLKNEGKLKYIKVKLYLLIKL